MIVPYPIPRLWRIADEAGIQICWYPDERFPRGRYCVASRHPFIFLNPALERSTMRLRCTLAHELGHHFVGIGAGSDGRDDERAMRWAHQLVLPTAWIIPRLHMEPWQIAEEADIYQEWVTERIRMILESFDDGTAKRRFRGIRGRFDPH